MQLRKWALPAGLLMIASLVIGAAVAFSPRADPPPQPPPRGWIEGHIKIAVEGLKYSDLGPVVVFLDARAGELTFETPKETPVLSQKDARFHPDFLVICRGQTVAMPNDDEISHNAFSYSKPNGFDLGLYPKGVSKSVHLKYPGTVQVYCSIHAKMAATILVAPSPWFARADDQGRFRIEGLPPGDYAIESWTRSLPKTRTPITVEANRATMVDIPLGSS